MNRIPKKAAAPPPPKKKGKKPATKVQPQWAGIANKMLNPAPGGAASC